MISKPRTTQRLKRGIPLLPSLFTVGNLFCGYYSIIATLQGQYSHAALDVLTFGMAPAALMFSWALTDLERIGWMTAFFFLACSATRLARFTVHTSRHERRYFAGLPAPPAAAMLGAVTFYAPAPVTSPALAYGLVSLIVVLALLMISKLRYRSFKDIDLRQRRPYSTVALLAIVFALIANAPQTVLLLMAATYVVSGPAERLWLQMRRRRNAAEDPAASLPEPVVELERPAIDTDDDR